MHSARLEIILRNVIKALILTREAPSDDQRANQDSRPTMGSPSLHQRQYVYLSWLTVLHISRTQKY